MGIRLTAVNQLATIAAGLGEERTRRELLPYVVDSADDEDEVLLALATELAKFVPLLGGSQYAHLLLNPLESLLAVDETVVRDAALQTLHCIIQALTPAAASEYLVSCVKVRVHPLGFK